MDWDDLRVVLALARGASLNAAARRLSVDPTTVARRLASLERAAGVALFHRLPGRMVPTEAGEETVAHAERVEAEIAALAETLTGAGHHVQGTVRLTAVPGIVNRLLVPRLGELLTRHPALAVELLAESRNLSLRRRDADVAVRLARPERDHALTRRLGTLSYSVYVPFESRREALPWIGYEEGHANLPQARWLAARATSEPRIRLSDVESVLQAVAAGLGRSLLPDRLVDEEPRVCRHGGPVLEREVWLLVHPDVRHLPRVAAVVDWLDAIFASVSCAAPGCTTGKL